MGASMENDESAVPAPKASVWFCPLFRDAEKGQMERPLMFAAGWATLPVSDDVPTAAEAATDAEGNGAGCETVPPQPDTARMKISTRINEEMRFPGFSLRFFMMVPPSSFSPDREMGMQGFFLGVDGDACRSTHHQPVCVVSLPNGTKENGKAFMSCRKNRYSVYGFIV